MVEVHRHRFSTQSNPVHTEGDSITHHAVRDAHGKRRSASTSCSVRQAHPLQATAFIVAPISHYATNNGAVLASEPAELSKKNPPLLTYPSNPLHCPIRRVQLHKIGRVILMVLFTTNIVGNLSVLIVMWGTGRKKRMRFFIMNLAVTDLFVAVGGILPELIWNLTVNFYAPDIVCRLVKYMSVSVLSTTKHQQAKLHLLNATATYASSFALVVLSFDRAEAVINPLRSTKKTCFGGRRFVFHVFIVWAIDSIGSRVILPYISILRMTHLQTKYA
ncbi:Neuropeptide S receptor [Taenia solium]|eukprot:TsM_000235900 transcript=TsM_000235900 gene=TsM_000235900